MQSEILFIAVILAPWVLVLMAVLFYRRRRMRKEPNGSAVRRRESAGRAGDPIR